MRTIVTGTVNGVAFSLKEDGKTVCKEAKYGKLISNCALQAILQAKQDFKTGCRYLVILEIADQLKHCKEANIQIDKAIEYKNGCTAIHYFNTPETKDISKKVFLQGKFQGTGSFKILVDHSTQVFNPEGKEDKAYSKLLSMCVDQLASQFTGPQIANLNVEIYKRIEREILSITIEKAYLYHYPLDPNVIY